MSDKSMHSLQVSFRDILYHLFRFKYTGLIGIVLVVAIGLGVTMRTEKRYSATAKLMLIAGGKDINLVQQASPTLRLNLEERVYTEIEALKSWRRFRPVLDSLAAKGLNPSGLSDLSQFSLTATPVHKSSFINVTLMGPDAELTANFLNEAMRQYVRSRNVISEDQSSMSRYEVSVDNYNQEIGDLEQDLAELKDEYDIILIEDQVRNLLATLEDLRGDRVTLSRELRKKQTDLQFLEELRTTFRPEFITIEFQNRFPQLRYVVNSWEQARQNLAENELIYVPGHPKIVQLKQDIKDYENTMAAVVDQQLGYLRDDVSLGEEDLGDTEREIRNTERRLSELSGVERSYEQRVSRLGELQNLRSTVVRKIEEMKLQGFQTSDNRFELVSEALPSRTATVPNFLYNGLLTAFMALLLGIGGPLLRWKLDDSIVTESDAERLTGLNALGSIREAK